MTVLIEPLTNFERSKLMDKDYNLPTHWTIKTFLLGPTNYRGTRVKAVLKRDSETSWSFTHDWQYDLSTKENHIEACRGLINSKNFFQNEIFEIKSIGYDYEHYYFTIGEPEEIAELRSWED